MHEHGSRSMLPLCRGSTALAIAVDAPPSNLANVRDKSRTFWIPLYLSRTLWIWYAHDMKRQKCNMLRVHTPLVSCRIFSNAVGRGDLHSFAQRSCFPNAVVCKPLLGSTDWSRVCTCITPVRTVDLCLCVFDSVLFWVWTSRHQHTVSCARPLRSVHMPFLLLTLFIPFFRAQSLWLNQETYNIDVSNMKVLSRR